jgi:nitroreductase
MPNQIDLVQALKNRRSVRGFKPDPIEPAVINEILALANRSPSFTNSQPWEVAVVTGKTRDALSKTLLELATSNAESNPDLASPTSWPDNIAARTKTHNINRFKHLGIGREDTEKRTQMRLKNYEFFDAPCALFVFKDEGCGEWSTMDIGGFTQSIALAAQAYGLGTCMQASLTYYPDAVKAALDMPSTKKLLVGMSIGVPDFDAPLNAYHSSRINLDEFVRWYE